MQAGKNKNTIDGLKLRAKLPKIIGVAAIIVSAVCVAVIGISVYRSSQDREFRMQGFPASLSKDVVATIDGYERREIDGNVVKYYIKADRAVSFADNHQELENVYLEAYSADGAAADRISASKGVFVPGTNKNFTAYFAGAVNIETRDQLKVRTEQLTYNRETEIATAEETVEFECGGISGKAVGSTVNVKEKVLELAKDVVIDANGDREGEHSKLAAGKARYYQAAEKIELEGGVNIANVSAGTPPKNTELAATRAIAFLTDGEDAKPAIDRIELFDAIVITTRQGDGPPTTLNANYALYVKPSSRFELRGSVHIKTSDGGRDTEIKADEAFYEQAAGKIDLNGNASLTQAASYVSGDKMHADLDDTSKVKAANVKGNALVRQITPERTTQVAGPAIAVRFAEGQILENARVSGSGNVEVVPSDPSEYKKLTVVAQTGIVASFRPGGLLSKIDTEGRTAISVAAANNGPDAANKSIAADAVSTVFDPNGKDLSTAAAAGNAELIVMPLNASESNYKTTINAPRFDCEFFKTGNDPKNCVAANKTKTLREPTRPSEGRGDQNLTAECLEAKFAEQGRGLEQLDAAGNAKFTELDRNAVANKIVYSTADQIVRLRGGEPNVWDGKARARAAEIDWDTRNQVSELRGGASTTYYSQKSTGGATPFGRSEKPVFVTARTARFDHRAEVAVYSGNARGWQDNNYVRGERLTISERDGRLVAEENVQSLLYESKRVENGVESNQPIFASAQRLTYDRTGRVLHYENNVDIRQGKDRISGGSAKVFLTEANQPSRTEIERNVIITQPARKAAADFARYETASETLFLQGSPATVEDAEQGRSQGAEITLNLKDNRFSTNAAKAVTGGRTRSVYKIKDQ